MRFRSLDTGIEASFGTALHQGLAPDGSLYVPQEVPQIDKLDMRLAISAGRQASAQAVLHPWLLDEMSREDVATIVRQASTFPTPVKDVGGKKVLELFHGPTLAFKDVAARYLASFMGYFSEAEGRESTVLVATSGDTGGAIAHGFANVESTGVVVLYPKGQVSVMQRDQLRRTAPNVHTLEVDGSFDDCQDLVKTALVDPSLSVINPTSANSINIGRGIPQITYYADGSRQLGFDDSVRFTVPTGNMGNLTAGVMAWRMGVPISGFLAANNANNVLHRYLETGEYDPRNRINTHSNAMDVARPNNFPRFLHLFGGDVEAARTMVASAHVEDDEVKRTILQVFEEHDYLLDPHTAVAWAASEKQPPKADQKDVIVSTASPLKFASEIKKMTGIEVDDSAELVKLRETPEEYDEMPVSYDQFKGYLMSKSG